MAPVCIEYKRVHYLFNTVTRRKQIIRRRGARYRNRDVNR